MDLARLQGESRTFTVDPTGRRAEPGEDTLTVTYRPAAVTLATLSKAQSGNVEVMAEALSSILVEWDLESGGEVVPTTADAISGLPVGAVSFVMQALEEDASPGKANGEVSGVPSLSAKP